MDIKWKYWLTISAIAITGQIALAQNSSGNMVSGEAKSEILRTYTGSQPLPKPDRVWIKDFTVSGDVVMDNSRAAHLLHRSDDDANPQAVVEKVQASFAKTLIAELQKLDVESERMPDTDVRVFGSTLIVEGEFIGIDEGDKAKRILIGFGRGASDIKTHMTISLVRGDERAVVLECNLNSASGKKPGAVATMGGGSLAVGAATGTITDKKATVEGDASRMAKAVAKQVKTVMIAQKWIPDPTKPSTAAPRTSSPPNE
jgi:uncharacterized protein DUF4410